jgi:hypothetical protein
VLHVALVGAPRALFCLACQMRFSGMSASVARVETRTRPMSVPVGTGKVLLSSIIGDFLPLFLLRKHGAGKVCHEVASGAKTDRAASPRDR